ncbi:MAG: ferric reductase-like transmembrane domain-containing protein [Natronospirillum sp.]|uniref:ferric reductase-like transmembrane domain-containing protein n=1 Tax=Natronospirillum sp. TaxID=2812955 RepID=UPI0025D0607B|nr:ferric reductase-like transmembrane domain-containing protein [Natronospirillum sp.]MCH8552295.1 ferric reductase-like transmembrane domain-containing protein [Natronospirillum sp.]
MHSQWEPLHRWNRAFGDTALILLALAMALGPLAALFPRARGGLVWRRQVGIWAMMLALVHVVIILHAWVEWNLIRLFGFEYSPMFRRYIMHQHGFGLANAVGILALLFGLVLMLTSNDRSVRWLTPTVWHYLHRGAVTFWWLVVVHVGYFLFIHFLDVRRPMLEPNPLQWPFVMLIILVSSLRGAAFMLQWDQIRRSNNRQ